MSEPTSWQMASTIAECVAALGALAAAIVAARAAQHSRVSAEAGRRAAEIAERAAEENRRAAEGALLSRILDQYAQPEMASNLAMLHEVHDRYRGDFASRWVRRLDAQDPHARRLDAARRYVSSYFCTADTLRELEILSNDTWRKAVDMFGAPVFIRVVGPLDAMKRTGANVNPVVDRLRAELGDPPLGDFVNPPTIGVSWGEWDRTP